MPNLTLLEDSETGESLHTAYKSKSGAAFTEGTNPLKKLVEARAKKPKN